MYTQRRYMTKCLAGLAPSFVYVKGCAENGKSVRVRFLKTNRLNIWHAFRRFFDINCMQSAIQMKNDKNNITCIKCADKERKTLPKQSLECNYATYVLSLLWMMTLTSFDHCCKMKIWRKWLHSRTWTLHTPRHLRRLAPRCWNH